MEIPNLSPMLPFPATETPAPAPEVVPAVGGAAPTPRRHRARSLFARVALGVVVVLLGSVLWSYGHALVKPGTDSLGVRSVEWVRDHGGTRLVAWTEREWYSHHAPPKGGVPKHLPATAGGTTADLVPAYDTPSPVHLLVDSPLPGEGQWQPGPRALHGIPALYTTFMRPDNIHTSLVTGLAWFNIKLARFELWSGNEEPGGSGWTLQAPIPVGVRPDLLAAFNSGFRLRDSHGGYMAEGRIVRPLVPGKASMMFHADGSLEIGQWGRDVNMAPDVVAVRQNLLLLVDGGQPVPNLDQDSLARWGFTPGNRTLVWRSGVGVDAHGNIVYAAGNGLSVQSLANVLAAAGAVRAMELDINSAWVDLFTYHDDANQPGDTGGTKLVDDMHASPARYFQPSSRDFIAAFLRTHPR